MQPNHISRRFRLCRRVILLGVRGVKEPSGRVTCLFMSTPRSTSLKDSFWGGYCDDWYGWISSGWVSGCSSCAKPWPRFGSASSLLYIMGRFRYNENRAQKRRSIVRLCLVLLRSVCRRILKGIEEEERGLRSFGKLRRLSWLSCVSKVVASAVTVLCNGGVVCKTALRQSDICSWQR